MLTFFIYLDYGQIDLTVDKLFDKMLFFLPSSS